MHLPASEDVRRDSINIPYVQCLNDIECLLIVNVDTMWQIDCYDNVDQSNHLGEKLIK